MSEQTLPANPVSPDRKFHYGWVIVAVSTLMIAICYGLMFSYSIFFKPLAEHFSWDRATVSLIYSSFLITRGFISIGTGWLADKYGAAKIMVFCGFMTGLGLVLTSQVQTLWQFFVSYALVEAICLSGSFGVATSMTSRWFLKNRGLALGIVSSGSGIGTLLIVPGTERLINALDWSWAFIITGIAAGGLTIAAALFLRLPPKTVYSISDAGKPSSQAGGQKYFAPRQELSLTGALRNPHVIMVITILPSSFSVARLSCCTWSTTLQTSASALLWLPVLSVSSGLPPLGAEWSWVPEPTVSVFITL
jgi:MFS family permease